MDRLRVLRLDYDPVIQNGEMIKGYTNIEPLAGKQLAERFCQIFPRPILPEPLLILRDRT
jgi:hypothetical protein